MKVGHVGLLDDPGDGLAVPAPSLHAMLGSHDPEPEDIHAPLQLEPSISTARAHVVEETVHQLG